MLSQKDKWHIVTLPNNAVFDVESLSRKGCWEPCVQNTRQGMVNTQGQQRSHSFAELGVKPSLLHSWQRKHTLPP